MILSIDNGRHVFVLRGSRTTWRLERWKHGRDGFVAAGEYPLDYDRRHRRLFLREKDERAVGPAGITALEKLTRQALGPP